MPANLVFRRKIWGARDNGIPPRSTPGYDAMVVSRPNENNYLFLPGQLSPSAI